MHFICAFLLVIVSLLVAGFLPLAARAQVQEKRVALVIGNSDYLNAPRLENPKNDASDMSIVLESLGFQVMRGLNLDKAATDRMIRDFAAALGGARAGLFFYAGHGLQVSGQNYVVPVDARLTTAAALDFEMIPLDLVQRTMERETNTNIIILDACRNNPLARNLARALDTRSAQIGRGLASVESGEGTLISFSTQPGNVALDGAGRNSPFTAALMKNIAAPGDDLPTILINTRNDVMIATERRQVPWEHSAMTARFFFTAPQASDDQKAEIEFWNSVKDSPDPNMVSTYLRKYPQGTFAVVARNLMDALEYQQEMEKRVREERDKRELEKAQEELRKAQEAAKTAAADPGATPPISPPPASGRGRGSFDGFWRFSRSTPGCPRTAFEFSAPIRNGRLTIKVGEGALRSSGEFTINGRNPDGARWTYKGKLAGAKGHGQFSLHNAQTGFRCGGPVTVTKLSD